ncbi:hypothetical protein PGTUg99_030138 [Puccinia graminis f. sp. tritici]|uniref:Uncharacterized protein n=1 Tax=Puccinia graminis f. sp. tritici TaxID=56615 RepID=A0A5B0RVV4_PUCGR|nr:hypothetical protein PGTUg99_030138 [Puccinia graminis f. sp. tritici]
MEMIPEYADCIPKKRETISDLSGSTPQSQSRGLKLAANSAPLSTDIWLFNSPRTLSTKAIQARPNSQAKLLRLPSLRNRWASQHCTAAVIGIISPKSHPCTLVPQKMLDNRSSSRFSFRLDTRIPEKEALNMKFF